MGSLANVDAALRGQMLSALAQWVAQLPQAPAAPRNGPLALLRPEGLAQLARLLFAAGSHLPWTSAEQTQQGLAEPANDYWTQTLAVLSWENTPCGLVAVGPVRHSPGIAFFGLLPAFREPGLLQPIVENALRQLSATFNLLWAIYDEPYAAAFGGLGFAPLATRQKIAIPLVAAPVKGTHPLEPLMQADVPPLLEQLGWELDCPLDQVRESASFVHRSGGAIRGAFIVSSGPREDGATLEQVWTDDSMRGQGLASTLSQTALNALVSQGVQQFEAWEVVSNDTVQGLNRRYAVGRDGPLRHYAVRQDR